MNRFYISTRSTWIGVRENFDNTIIGETPGILSLESDFKSITVKILSSIQDDDLALYDLVDLLSRKIKTLEFSDSQIGRNELRLISKTNPLSLVLNGVEFDIGEISRCVFSTVTSIDVAHIENELRFVLTPEVFPNVEFLSFGPGANLDSIEINGFPNFHTITFYDRGISPDFVSFAPGVCLFNIDLSSVSIRKHFPNTEDLYLKTQDTGISSILSIGEIELLLSGIAHFNSVTFSGMRFAFDKIAQRKSMLKIEFLLFVDCVFDSAECFHLFDASEISLKFCKLGNCSFYFQESKVKIFSSRIDLRSAVSIVESFRDVHFIDCDINPSA